MSRVERALLGEGLRHLRDAGRPLRSRQLVYHTTGEPAAPGTYHCTLCGGALRLHWRAALPLCAECDGAEFVAADPPSELPTPLLPGASVEASAG